MHANWASQLVLVQYQETLFHWKWNVSAPIIISFWKKVSDYRFPEQAKCNILLFPFVMAFCIISWRNGYTNTPKIKCFDEYSTFTWIKQICLLFSSDKMEILIPTVPSTNQIQDHTQTVRGRQMGLADTWQHSCDVAHFYAPCLYPRVKAVRTKASCESLKIS